MKPSYRLVSLLWHVCSYFYRRWPVNTKAKMHVWFHLPEVARVRNSLLRDLDTTKALPSASGPSLKRSFEGQSACGSACVISVVEYLTWILRRDVFSLTIIPLYNILHLYIVLLFYLIGVKYSVRASFFLMHFTDAILKLSKHRYQIICFTCIFCEIPFCFTENKLNLLLRYVKSLPFFSVNLRYGMIIGPKYWSLYKTIIWRKNTKMLSSLFSQLTNWHQFFMGHNIAS